MRSAINRVSGASLALALAGVLLVQCDSGVDAVSEKVYLLEDASNQEWCIYTNEREWKADVELRGAMKVATVDQVNGRITWIRVTEQDETGDWIVYDTYSLDANARMSRIKRTANILPGDRSEERIFLVRAGRAVGESSATRRLGTGEPFRAAENWLPNVPIVTSVEALPFSPLIEAERLTTLRSQSCTPVGQ